MRRFLLRALAQSNRRDQDALVARMVEKFPHARDHLLGPQGPQIAEILEAELAKWRGSP